ncbi:hypothetical protein, variant [Aphanomyces astaci]|uniref:Uncharacterized protein n=1 Tax=Aphanomyces astaci TaxID=112090 RepID=W4HBN6_APHAT|nr:hypothetical protein H257_00666 [Aphanomyces astaci]XP_009821748.1 hypothetical protein, variant [Aphanomyces astaci]ETV89347.1 hypothetical protein H257_00666 [Aphanomyces astaci]ETV89348.1 hypothetical protein, variant [Aphanomyces astaci]|eukprot:XP_009821747.1 hypothetical protein H257_00666 [Aphanomyces astaci]
MRHTMLPKVDRRANPRGRTIVNAGTAPTAFEPPTPRTQPRRLHSVKRGSGGMGSSRGAERPFLVVPGLKPSVGCLVEPDWTEGAAAVAPTATLGLPEMVGSTSVTRSVVHPIVAGEELRWRGLRPHDPNGNRRGSDRLPPTWRHLLLPV